MKMVSLVTNVVSATAAVALITACQSTATSQSSSAQQETLLAQSGFRTFTVTTPQQQAAVGKLAVGQVSPVKYHGKLYYVYPTTTKDKIYVGRAKQANAYNKALAAQQTQTQAGQNNMNPAPTMTYQGHGQHQIVAQEFDGFGPMGVNAMGDW
jgi:hypothetical protein